MNKDIKSLYIHIPFCEKICDYCDFTKLQYFRMLAIKYIESLKDEIASRDVNINLETIYIGGGTPTVLEDDLFLELLKIVNPYAQNVKEYTIEANPESLSEIKLKMMKQYGVSRISIGVESTNDEILKSINRNHTFNDVIKCVNLARKIGFNNINLDLILGLPNVLKSLLDKDIDNLLSLNVEHISCYSLSVHPNTVFYLKGIKENSGDIERDLYDLVNNKLINNGYVHYEVSNWSKPNKYSLHNLTYWKNEQYYGVGLGASGYIGNLRYTNTKNLNKYLDNNFNDYQEELSLTDKIEYSIMLNLRTTFGLDLNLFKSSYHYDLYESKKDIIDSFINSGHLYLENNVLKPTYEGMMTLEQIILALI